MSYQTNNTRLTHSYQYHENNKTYPWSYDRDARSYHDDNVSTIIVIATLLFMLAIIPVIFSLLQKYCGNPDPFASDGNTVTLENDKTNDVEMNSVLEDISQKSAPHSLHSLHDTSIKGRRLIVTEGSGAPSQER